MGYDVVTITECEWREPVTPTLLPTMTEKDREDSIMEGDIFGILKCSLKVPEGLKEQNSRGTL